jgi:ABC-type molybdate transport system substrate-binding protein
MGSFGRMRVNMDEGCRAKWRNLRGVILCAITLFLAPGPVLAGSPGEITISAAASLKNAFEEMGKGFTGKPPGMKVRFNIAGSGDLQRQIEAAAPLGGTVPVSDPGCARDSRSL